MFSPITERSKKVKGLYLTVYTLLALGGISMVLPFLIMIAGSLEPFPQSGVHVFPSYLVSPQQMWKRFLQVKYAGDAEFVRASWSDESFDFRNPQPPAPASEEEVARWQKFLADTKPPASNFLLAFGPSPGMPSYSERLFRQELLQKFDHDLEHLNRTLGTTFATSEAIRPPVVTLLNFPPISAGLGAEYFAFLTRHPGLCVPADAGGYYRAIFLPSRFGGSLDAFNEKYGTTYASWNEIPFSATAPEPGREEWHFFATQVLRPDLVKLTPAGEAALKATGMSVREFIRSTASIEDIQLETIDLLFAEWSLAETGRKDARIPQRNVDERQFREEGNTWKWRFLALNYLRVADEMLLHGHAFTNTLILVVLFVVGALTINPLAAYALSRFKFRQTYAILLFCLVTAAFPAEVLMIPVFLQLKEFQLLNTFGALVIPTLANGFSIFLLKGFFDSLPKELYEAAELDGAGEFVMFWHITMNLSKPILAVIALGAFNAAYGTFFYALILAPDPAVWTIMVYIFQLQSSAASPVVYASLLLASIPTLLVFILCQKVILNGIVVPSEK